MNNGGLDLIVIFYLNYIKIGLFSFGFGATCTRWSRDPSPALAWALITMH